MRVQFFTLIFLCAFVFSAYSQTHETGQVKKIEKVSQTEAVKSNEKPEKPAQPASPLTLKESTFCKGVEEREPVSRAEKFGSDIGTIFFWSNILNDGNEASVEHIWIYNDVEMARVLLPARYERNRVWSSKKILPEWKGEWKVIIVADSDTLGERTCVIE